LQTGLYILLALISFYFLFLFNSFLMISRRKIIPGSAGPIFAIFARNESVLVQMIDLDLFFDISRTLPWQLFFEKVANSAPYSSLWYSETDWDIATAMCTLGLTV